ncbi:hypothetical protein [Luteolibacter luteus]|uniref:Uncharacterized protein n=1 Tax=Luteolibacter luteus TaxID=2728835 RepID=A0A858RCK6_9BACT|nr:hypothetical protein [Luteolibacter luteus]QJE94425.1 hypothetical protein HHL09_01030 [Luteolibacter luteus]
MHHAQARYTKDLDLWIRPETENSKKVAKALTAFGVPLREVTTEDFAQEGLQFVVGVPPCAVDFLTTVEGIDFESAWNSRVQHQVDDVPVLYLSLRDLMTTKRTVGRAQDLADIEEPNRPPRPGGDT